MRLEPLRSRRPIKGGGECEAPPNTPQDGDHERVWETVRVKSRGGIRRRGDVESMKRARMRKKIERTRIKVENVAYT